MRDDWATDFGYWLVYASLAGNTAYAPDRHMNFSAIFTQMLDSIAADDGTLRWLALGFLLLAWALIAQQRAKRLQRLAEQAKQSADEENLGGNSYFMPLPQMEQAVEVANPVEIESLLTGHPLPTPHQGVNNPLAPNPIARAVTAPARGTTVSQDTPALVRDLVLTWFEARGYRATPLPEEFRPLELKLHHRSEPGRHYAFAVEPERATALRALALLKLARAAGQDRLLIAAEGGCDPGVARELRQAGIRVFDKDSIRTELEKIDLKVAAKIIAVARSRVTTELSVGNSTLTAAH